MTPNQIDLVQTSWEQVVPIAKDAAALFYNRLFEIDPSLRKIFGDDIEEQGKKLMTVLTTVVRGLKKLDALEATVWRLGSRHAVYEVKQKDYDTMSDIDRFIATLKDAIQHLIVENHADPIDGVIVSEHDEKSVLLPLARQFGVLQGYENIFRQIMLSSKALPQLSADEQIESYQVAGCEVDVWLKYVSQTDSFEAFANSKIIRGLLAILLEKANALSHQQRAQFDFAQYLTELGITHHLSQSRVNGLSRVIAQLSA